MIMLREMCNPDLNRERQNTNVLFRDGLIRSSDDPTVMEGERRDRVIQLNNI